MVRKVSKKRLQTLWLLGLSLVLIFAVVAKIDSIQYWLIGATGQEASIQIDAKAELGPLKTSWRTLAQGGESKDYHYEPVTSQIRALGVNYIRIDHIYDFYDIVSRDSAGQLQFDFSKFDVILKEIQASGATPFIALTYMPPAISRGDIVDLPRSWSEWQLTIQKTVEHVSGAGGLNIPNVYYEVWNEPDLFGQWKTYGEKNYLDLYYYAAKGAEQAKATQPFKIGGPATTAIYDNWVTKFLDFTSKNNLRVDFYSWHRYALPVERFNQDLIQMGKLLENYPQYSQSLEFIISEWGPDSNNNAAYDGKLAAAHFVAVSSQISPYLSHLIAFEIQDGKDPEGKQYWGRWGMMTHQDFGNVPKPRYRAMQLMNQMSGNQLALVGNGTWVKAISTKLTDGSIQIIMANYDPQGNNAESVPVTLRNLTAGNYILAQEFLGRPISRTRLSTHENGDLVFTLPMQANDVALLTITRSAIQ